MRNVDATKRGFGYDYASQSLGLYVDGVMAENFSASTNTKFYVDQASGDDSNNGRSWAGAFKKYQTGVTAATAAEYLFKDVDLFVGAGEYDEQIVLSGDQQGIGTPGVEPWYGYKIGRLRIFHMGKAVVIKNSGDDSSHTLDIKRSKVELYGGTFRNYTNAGTVAAVHWDRELLGGDVINGLMYGCKVEGRTNQIGIDIDGAQYIWIERCVISANGTCGILIAGNNLGWAVENVVRDCYFRGNTVDIMMGAAQFTLIEDCKFVDDASDDFVLTSTLPAPRAGACQDTAVVNCAMNCASVNNQLHTGVKYMGTKVQDY